MLGRAEYGVLVALKVADRPGFISFIDSLRHQLLERSEKRGQLPLPGRPEGCFAQRYLTPYFPNAFSIAPRSTEMISGGDPNSPMRTWAQMAPPKKPVTRIAPRTAVAGMA